MSFNWLSHNWIDIDGTDGVMLKETYEGTNLYKGAMIRNKYSQHKLIDCWNFVNFLFLIWKWNLIVMFLCPELF